MSNLTNIGSNARNLTKMTELRKSLLRSKASNRPLGFVTVVLTNWSWQANTLNIIIVKLKPYVMHFYDIIFASCFRTVVIVLVVVFFKKSSCA